jgi:ABC-type uncharacterized transport system ATPase subunit
MVFQEFELLEYLSVLDNILLPYRINASLKLDPRVRDRADRLAGQVGIKDKLGRYATKLSHGEKQRVDPLGMHMHVTLQGEAGMRTTIEIRDEHRAKLLEIAARRGEKGFSSIVSEAIELYLRTQLDVDQARLRALEVRGALDEDEALALRDETSRIRAAWR